MAHIVINDIAKPTLTVVFLHGLGGSGKRRKEREEQEGRGDAKKKPYIPLSPPYISFTFMSSSVLTQLQE
jgi:hypothetical protein